MSVSIRAWLVFGVLLAVAPSARAQDLPADRPTIVQPKTPQTRAELDRREAVKLYARGLSLERDSLLLEAAKVYEQALDLDPESAAVRKALAPLYLALDRTDDALEVCREVVERDPGDYETWYLLARQYRLLDKAREAVDALNRGSQAAGLKEHPELRLQFAFDLVGLYEGLEDFAAAEKSAEDVAAQLESPEALVELGVFTRDEAGTQAAEAYERLGKMALRAKHPDKSVAAYKKAQEKDPRRVLRLAYNLADVYQAQGQFDKALASLDEYLRTQPQGAEAYEVKITILKKLNRDRDIVPALQAHSRVDAENVDLKLLLARECNKSGLGRQAEQIYLDLLKKTARADVYKGLFDVYKGQGPGGGNTILGLLDDSLKTAAPVDPNTAPNPADAGVAAARARAMLMVIRDDPEIVKLLLPAARPTLVARWRQEGLHAETRRLLAVLAARTRQLEDAEQLYRGCLQEGFFGRRGEGELYGGLLGVLWQARKYEAIVKLCQDGLANAQVTNRVLFHVNLAQAFMRLDKSKEALEQANQAVDLSGEGERSLSRRIRISVLADAGQFADAEADARAWLKEAKDDDEVLDCRWTLSEIYSVAKKHAQSEEQLQIILKQHPDDARAHNDLGYTWADQGKNLDEAERLVRRALELDRRNRTSGAKVDADAELDNAAYVDSLGWVLFRRDKLDEAKAELEKAVKLPDGEEDPVVWDHLGDVYYRLKESEKARASWTKSLELTAKSRRKLDERVRDVRAKLKLLEPAAKPR